jgi:imidazolonepropionase-like amidohydrolase
MSSLVTRCRLPAAALFSVLLMPFAQAAATDPVVLHDVRLIDGNGGAPREHVDLLLSGERIRSVGYDGEFAKIKTAQLITLSGKTVLPGLISDHSHLGLVDGTGTGGNNATPQNILRQLRQYEVFGVTTVMSLGLNQKSFYDLQPALHAGTQPGADFFGADRGFGVKDGAPPAAMGMTADQVYRPSTVAEARQQVRETAARHPSMIKVWVDDFHGAVPVKVDPAIYRAIIDEAHGQGIRVAAHVYYLEDAKRLVADGVDVLAHGVRDKPVDDEFVRAMKKRGVWYIPTLGLDQSFYLFAKQPELTATPILHQALQPALAAQLADAGWRQKILSDEKKLATDEASFKMNEENALTLYQAGIKVGFGTDSGATPLRVAGFAEHHELLLLTQAGLTPLQAIGTATKDAAELLHLKDRGVIEKGRLADLLVVDGNPAVNIADVDRIVAVWHRGKQVAGDLGSFTP